MKESKHIDHLDLRPQQRVFGDFAALHLILNTLQPSNEEYWRKVQKLKEEIDVELEKLARAHGPSDTIISELKFRSGMRNKVYQLLSRRPNQQIIEADSSPKPIVEIAAELTGEAA